MSAALKHKPLQHLEEELNEPSKNYISVEPHFLKKLAGRMKTQEIADSIGYTSSGISAALNSEKVRKVIELACEQVWETKFGARIAADKPVCAFVTGDLKLMKMVQSMVDIGAGNFAFIELPK